LYLFFVQTVIAISFCNAPVVSGSFSGLISGCTVPFPDFRRRLKTGVLYTFYTFQYSIIQKLLIVPVQNKVKFISASQFDSLIQLRNDHSLSFNRSHSKFTAPSQEAVIIGTKLFRNLLLIGKLLFQLDCGSL